MYCLYERGVRGVRSQLGFPLSFSTYASACAECGRKFSAFGGTGRFGYFTTGGAALASAMCLTVLEPCSNGIGGDAFALIWDGGEDGELHGFNGSGRSPEKVFPCRQ